MEKLNIAVVGSGISGLSASWLLAKRHNVTLYEAGNYPGGHSNTVDVGLESGTIPVDTGFIVYNERNYPNLTALFAHLGVATDQTEMSFALSLNNGAYEYSGSRFGGFFGQRRNFVNPHHWRLLHDLNRFFSEASGNVARNATDMSLGEFLRSENYSDIFIEAHILPMGAAIWSTSMGDMLQFPARSFIDFYANHGMLQFRNRPLWNTVSGGSRQYVAKMLADGPIETVLNNPVRKVVRHEGYAHIVDARDVLRPFDHVVIATHADQALKLLEKPTTRESSVLGRFSYQPNRAVLHRDPAQMPKRRRLWSSWNYLKRGVEANEELCVTYWMNRLQNLDGDADIFVTLNPASEIHPKLVEQEFDYDHPVFDAGSLAAQKELWALQGLNHVWFCGSYFGHGFHEDGIQSGLAVAEQLGNVRRPWRIENESGRIAMRDTQYREAAA